MNFHIVLRLLLEIIILVGIGYGSFNMGNTFSTKLFLCIGFLVITIIIWGTFGSPNAPFVLQGYSRLLLEVGMLFVAIVLLSSLLHPFVISFFAILFFLNSFFISEFK